MRERDQIGIESNRIEHEQCNKRIAELEQQLAETENVCHELTRDRECNQDLRTTRQDHKEEQQVLLTRINELEQELIERNALLEKQQKAHEQWMAAGMRAGFVFSVGSAAFEVEHDPKLATEIAKCDDQNTYEERIAELEKFISDSKDAHNLEDVIKIAELEQQLAEVNIPVKYYKDGGVIYAVYGTSSISYVTLLEQQLAEAELVKEKALALAVRWEEQNERDRERIEELEKLLGEALGFDRHFESQYFKQWQEKVRATLAKKG
jgi:uncharacterized protein with PIN domain